MQQAIPSARGRWLAFGALISTAMFWGGNAIVARGFNTEITPITLAFWRWSLATLFILPFTWKYLRRDIATLLGSWPVMLTLSFLGIALFNTVLYYAAHTTSAINIGLMQTIMPVVIIVLCFVIYGEGITRTQTLGVIAALLGGIVTVSRGDLDILLGFRFVAGDLLMIVAMTAYGLYSVLLRERPRIHPLSFVSATFLLGVIMLLPFYLWERVLVEAPVATSAALFASILYLSIFPSILAYVFWNYGVSVIGPMRAGLFVTLVPVFAAMLSLIFLDDPLQTYHGVGLVCIMVGIVLANRQDRPRSNGIPNP